MNKNSELFLWLNANKLNISVLRMKKNLQRHAIAQPKAEHEAAEQQPPQPSGYESLLFHGINHLPNVPYNGVFAFALNKQPLTRQAHNLYSHPIALNGYRVMQAQRIPPQQGIGNSPLNAYRIPHLHRIAHNAAAQQRTVAAFRCPTGSKQQGKHC
jgi:hypothetical protein